MITGGDDSNITFNWAARSWAKNVESTAWLGNGFFREFLWSGAS